MFKKLFLTFFSPFIFFILICPSKKENTNLFDYCYAFEKILTRNSLEKNKNISKKVKVYAKEITSLGTRKTKGDLVNKIIDQYKNSKILFLIVMPKNLDYTL